MQKIFKNLISGITVLSMCMSMALPLTVHADGETPSPGTETGTETEETTVRTLSVDFVGRITPITEIPDKPQKAMLTEADVGKEFWIGVAGDNLASNGLTLFSDGVYTFEVSFEYDPSFVEPYFKNADKANAEAEWLEELKTGNLADANSSLYWNKNQYEIISVRDTALDKNDERELLEKTEDERKNWRMCTVCVSFKDGATFSDTRFQGITDGAKQYFLKLPFILNKVPGSDDLNKNPTVLSLVRGPETFNVASNDKGTQYSEWEKTVPDPMVEDITNLKTLFTFAGDVSLFDQGAAIENIVAVKTKTGEETADTEYPLSKDTTLQKEPFDPEVTDFYVRVPNDVTKIKLNITASDNDDLTVTVNGGSPPLTTTAVSGEEKLYVTPEFNLNELNKDTDTGGTEDGFNNIVVVKKGDTEYKIHIKRLLKPRIELKPGNSPYGLIERMSKKYLGDSGWDDDTIKEAKKQFDESHSSRKKYGTLVPTDGQTKLTYTTKAWDSFKTFDKDEEGNKIPYNGDTDPTAMFVFQRRKFRDVGFEAYDAEGNPISSDVKVTRSVTVKTMANGVPSYIAANDTKEKITDLPITTDDSDSNHLFDELLGKNIRPDVYRMSYTFTDPITSETCKIERKLIVVSRHGDALINNDNTVNNPDASAIISNKGKINAGNSLYRFRVADSLVNTDDTVNNPDASTVVTNKSKLGEFYIYLPNS